MEGIFFLIVIFGFVLAMRYIQYRERMDMLRRGLTPKDYRPVHTSSGTTPTDYLTGTLLPPQYQQPGATQSYQQRAGIRSRFSPEAIKQRGDGITTLLVGFGITFGLGTIGWGPWLMPGFIVMFVGLSILINYYMTTDVAVPMPPNRQAVPPQQPNQPANYSVPAPPRWDAPQWSQPISDQQVPPPPTPYMGEQAKRE